MSKFFNKLKTLYDKAAYYKNLGGGSQHVQRDARIGAVGAQEVRDLYATGKSKEAEELAQRYAKANINGIALALGAKNAAGLLGDMAITAGTTAADTIVDGNTDNFKKNLGTNLAFDILGKGMGDLFNYAKNIDPHILRFVHSDVPNTLTTKQRGFWSGLTKGYLHYSDVPYDQKFIQLVKQGDPRKFKPSRFIPEVEDVVLNKSIRDDLRKSVHPYRYMWDKDGWKVYINPNHRADPTYAGARMAAEGFLAKGTGSLDPNSVHIPRNLITLMSPEKQQNAFKAMASLMATKVVSGVKSSYDAISDLDIKKVVEEGWKRGIWNSNNGAWSFKEFFDKNKDDIRRLMYRVPAVVGAGTVVTQKTKGDQ